MSDIQQLLKAALETGTTVTMAYAGGSRPGQPRDIIVLNCNETDLGAVEHPSRIKKHYKISKILWAKLKGQDDVITNDNAAKIEQYMLPIFSTLLEYAAHLHPQLVADGWWLEANEEYIHVGEYFKNGKQRKNPRFSIEYYDRTMEEEFDHETGDFVTVKHELTGRERPWRVCSSRLSGGKTYHNLSNAIQSFWVEVQNTMPQLPEK